MADESINFSKLEKEFYTAKHADEKYSRENDAKFRAVHQKVASYEEFRDIVTASHLRPLDRDDITGKAQTAQQWNAVHTNNKTEIPDHTTVTSSESQPISVKNKDDFIKAWKMCASKVDFLLQFDQTFLSSVLEYDIPFNMLEDTIDSLNKDFPITKISGVADILMAFTKSKRFDLTLKFLGKTDKQKLKQLFEKISNYGVDINELQDLYRVL